MSYDKDVLTTGEVAKLCNVAPRTVSKWFDSGQLGGYRIPGSRDRRIPLSELLRFMKAHGIPTEGIDSGRTRVLIVDPDDEICATLERVLGERTNYEIKSATSGFEAGLLCERFRPHVVLADLHLSDNEGRELPSMLRDVDGLEMTRVIAMSGKLTEGQAFTLRAEGFDSFLKKPFQVRQVVDAIEHATNLVA
jgi:excisionase family DNA binding protein